MTTILIETLGKLIEHWQHRHGTRLQRRVNADYGGIFVGPSRCPLCCQRGIWKVARIFSQIMGNVFYFIRGILGL